ncbi:nitroreductase family protein [Acidimicrobiia bacterium EGI L10123]|uniref:nitroreductase family protein n=1 Tax=Salinilacustrithrix flava TaxID=2957203 RepID=UPI003D7C2E90|nr:nitroreductase family protein [Acidimicrobiia bacterium EGI L10123]
MTQLLPLSADEVLATTRAVRKRLDFDRPVEDEVLRECLELALQAPSGSNAQSWRFVVVTDPDKKQALGELYRQAFDIYEQLDGINAATIYRGDDPERLDQQQRVMGSARYLAERMGEVPAMLVPCMPGRTDAAPPVSAAAAYGSILPAVWSFMLAGRARGLGTSWTTLHLMFEQQAAEILGIPFEAWTQVALVSVGYTKGTDFKRATREPLETAVSFNGWDFDD